MNGKKILHTADWHIGKRLQEFVRLEEQREVLFEIIDVATQEQVDIVIVAGDLFDVFHPSHESQELFYQVLFRLSDHGKRPVICIAGNHDSHSLIEAPLPLSRELGILLLGANHTALPEMTNAAGVRMVIPENGIVQLYFPDGDEVNVLVAPYANEQLLRTYLGEEDREDELRLILSTKWKKLASTYFTKESINLFAGHFFFMKEGSSADEEPESERSILHVGGAQALFTDELPDGLHYAALGHLHRYQIIDNRRYPVVYSSSPLCYSFSEAGQEKCVVIIEVDTSLTLTMRPVSLQSGFGLERVKFESLSDCITWLEAHQNCYVELTFITDEGLDVASRKAIMGAHPRIVHLIPQLRSAREELSNQVEAADLQADIRTLFQKYYFSQKGLEPNAELMGLFREVLGEGGES